MRCGAGDPEAVGGAVLDGAERSIPLPLRCPEAEQPPRAIRAEACFGAYPAVAHAQLVSGAARDGEISLMRIEGALDDLQVADQLGDDEMCVGVAMGVGVVDLVDRHPVHGEFDRLARSSVEAAEEHLLGMPFAAFVGDEDSWCQVEQILGILSRDDGQLPDVDLKVAPAPLDLALPAPYADFADRSTLSGSCWGWTLFRRPAIGTRCLGTRPCGDPGIRGRGNRLRNSGIRRSASGRGSRISGGPGRPRGSCGTLGDEAERDPHSSCERNAVAQGRAEPPLLHRIERRGVERCSSAHVHGRVLHRSVRTHRDEQPDDRARRRAWGRNGGRRVDGLGGTTSCANAAKQNDAAAAPTVSA